MCLSGSAVACPQLCGCAICMPTDAKEETKMRRDLRTSTRFAKPSFGQVEEIFRQIESGRITQFNLQEFLRFPGCSVFGKPYMIKAVDFDMSIDICKAQSYMVDMAMDFELDGIQEAEDAPESGIWDVQLAVVSIPRPPDHLKRPEWVNYACESLKEAGLIRPATLREMLVFARRHLTEKDYDQYLAAGSFLPTFRDHKPCPLFPVITCTVDVDIKGVETITRRLELTPYGFPRQYGYLFLGVKKQTQVEQSK